MGSITVAWIDQCRRSMLVWLLRLGSLEMGWDSPWGGVRDGMGLDSPGGIVCEGACGTNLVWECEFP